MAHDSGVYKIDIDTEHQVVIVSGCVDSSTLIKRLVKSGKRAELWYPTSKHKLKQEATMDQMHFLSNEVLNASKNQYMFPASFVNEDVRGFENLTNQNTGKKVADAETEQDLMVAKRMGNIYMDEDNFAGNTGVENDMTPLGDQADYQENKAGFLGLGGHEFDGMPIYKHNHLPSLIMSNIQQGPHYNYPSMAMQKNFVYMHDGHANNNMISDFCMHQPHVMNHALEMPPPYTGYSFSAAPPHSY